MHKRRWTRVELYFYVRAGSPPPTGQSLQSTPDTFYFSNLNVFVPFSVENEVKVGMLTKHLVVNFLILLFVLHQLWTCAFHCPRKSLNIPLLHVLVIILALFYQTSIL